MSQAPKDTRSAGEKARDAAGIVGSLKHEGYVPTPDAEAVHQRVARGEWKRSESFVTGRQLLRPVDRAVGKSGRNSQSGT
jgi:hypothetical protein